MFVLETAILIFIFLVLSAKWNKLLPIPLILTVLAMGFMVVEIYTYQETTRVIPTSGIVAFSNNESIAFTFYQDITRTKVFEHGYWGMIEVGGTSHISVYLANEGSVPFWGYTSGIDWNPIHAGNYIQITSDFGDEPIYPQRIRKVTFQLDVSSSVANSQPLIEDFGFDIFFNARDEPIEYFELTIDVVGEGTVDVQVNP